MFMDSCSWSDRQKIVPKVRTSEHADVDAKGPSLLQNGPSTSHDPRHALRYPVQRRISWPWLEEGRLALMLVLLFSHASPQTSVSTCDYQRVSLFTYAAMCDIPG